MADGRGRPQIRSTDEKRARPMLDRARAYTILVLSLLLLVGALGEAHANVLHVEQVGEEVLPAVVRH